MLTIQQVGAEILGDKPRTLYFFGGIEYGIKYKYIEHLRGLYKYTQELETMAEAVNLFKKKQLIPLPPKLYIIRYDDIFISTLTEKIAKQVNNLNIKGTIVCIYEAAKSVSKCNKFFPDNTVVIDPINPAFIKQYLKNDFPKLPDNLIAEAVRIHPDYMGAYNVCIGMNALDNMSLDSISSKQIDTVFGADRSATETQLRHAFASRNVYACTELLDNYPSDKNQVYYTWLSTLLELEKLLTNPKQKSDLRQYVRQWSIECVYNMFHQIYNELAKSRNSTYYNIDDRLLYLTLLLQYNPIPTVGVM